MEEEAAVEEAAAEEKVEQEPARTKEEKANAKKDSYLDYAYLWTDSRCVFFFS